jgi:3-isopropylmalate dehydrogenase
MQVKITLLPGDGIGPEVTAEGVKVLDAIGKKFGHTFAYTKALVGGIAIDQFGDPLPDESFTACQQADAVLLGAVGGPKWSDPKANVRPEQGLMRLRRELDLFANIRPVKVYPVLLEDSPLKREIIEQVDMVIVRELASGIYFGRPQGRQDNEQGRAAVDTLYYNERQIRRLMRVAFKMAQQRRKKITSVDKANILASSRLWREVAHEVAAEYPDVDYEDVLVDACAMYLIRTPAKFDVIATENLFGDILSDEASMLAGSMGMLPSASLSESKFGLYEPIHGSAPDIAGQGIANPLAAILSVAMMLRLSFDLATEADAVEQAVEAVLNAGYRTADLTKPGEAGVGTVEMGNLVVKNI